MSKEKICPHCKESIDNLDFDVTGGCSSNITQEEVKEHKQYEDNIKKNINHYLDYDIDCLIDGVTFNNFRCPECSHKICDTEEEARELLK